MYLKNLTVLGFKSFADKTSLNFQPGVTAIVGPNGCGKSNVSDAIRWVLGEQSAKALRGGEMADVIFNGTDGRKPLGMAEVSLTIGGVDEEHLSAAGVEMAYDEVTITRRVLRDGGSEYFINKTPCRLKDVQQLFMGTGVGRTSYSIMAQRNITQILSSKPEDRRLIFEEAAGITKFKAQKKESLRKLEYTEQNLLRVADLIREVKRQIGSLQRQAGKARRYKQLMQELQHLDTQLARHQFDVLQGEINERQGTAEKLRVEAELRRSQEAQQEAQSDAFAQAQELTRARNEINALDLQKQGNVVRLEKLSAEKIQLEEERGQLETRLQEFAASVEAEKLSAQTQRGTVEERQARLREIQQELTTLTQDLDGRLQQQAEKRSRLNVLEQLQSEHEGFSAGTLAALKNAEQVL